MQRSKSYINLDNIKIFSTPRKLVKSLQASNEHSDFPEKKSQRFKSPSSSKFDLNGLSGDLNDGFSCEDEHCHDTSDSVSSTEDILQELTVETKARRGFSAVRILSGLIVLFAVIVCFLFVGGIEEDYYLVPT